MNGPAATLEDVIASAASRRASLAPETSGYLILGVAEAAQRVPLLLDLQSVLITADGDVELRPSGEVVPPAEAGRKLRGLLGDLLAVSSGALPALHIAANPARSGEIDALVLDIEAALIPMNRAAGRRAIARLARDTLRAGSRDAAMRSVPPPRRASSPASAPAEPPSLPQAPAEPAAPPAPPAAIFAPIPRPPSPGERKLEALRGSLTRAALRQPFADSPDDARPSSEQTPKTLAASPSPSPSACSSSALTLPVLAVTEPAAPEPRGLTMRWSFAKDGSIGLLEGGAPALGRAEILAFFEQTPSAPIEFPGSPTIAMSVEPFAAEATGQTLPWPANYPYERIASGPSPIVESSPVPPPSAPEPIEILELSAETSHAASDSPESIELLAEPSDPTPESAPSQAPLPAGPDRADELLLRFAAGPDGETANIRAAAKGLRALAGVDLTPTATSLLPAATRPASPEPALSSDDITPPATSPGPASVRPSRPARRGFVRSAVAFAVGLAGATTLMHIEPRFPERVVELLDQAIPAADPPSPPGEPPAPPADAPEAEMPASP